MGKVLKKEKKAILKSILFEEKGVLKVKVVDPKNKVFKMIEEKIAEVQITFTNWINQLKASQFQQQSLKEQEISAIYKLMQKIDDKLDNLINDVEILKNKWVLINTIKNNNETVEQTGNHAASRDYIGGKRRMLSLCWDSTKLMLSCGTKGSN